jgi:hypothetical protein
VSRKIGVSLLPALKCHSCFLLRQSSAAKLHYGAHPRVIAGARTYRLEHRDRQPSSKSLAARIKRERERVATPVPSENPRLFAPQPTQARRHCAPGAKRARVENRVDGEITVPAMAKCRYVGGVSLPQSFRNRLEVAGVKGRHNWHRAAEGAANIERGGIAFRHDEARSRPSAPLQMCSACPRALKAAS